MLVGRGGQELGFKSPRGSFIHIHLDYIRVEFLSCIKKLLAILTVELTGTHIESLINCTIIKVFNFFLINLLIVITRNERLKL